MWQHVSLSKQVHSRETLACHQDTKQSMNKLERKSTEVSRLHAEKTDRQPCCLVWHGLKLPYTSVVEGRLAAWGRKITKANQLHAEKTGRVSRYVVKDGFKLGNTTMVERWGRKSTKANGLHAEKTGRVPCCVVWYGLKLGNINWWSEAQQPWEWCCCQLYDSRGRP